MLRVPVGRDERLLGLVDRHARCGCGAFAQLRQLRVVVPVSLDLGFRFRLLLRGVFSVCVRRVGVFGVIDAEKPVEFTAPGFEGEFGDGADAKGDGVV